MGAIVALDVYPADPAHASIEPCSRARSRTKLPTTPGAEVARPETSLPTDPGGSCDPSKLVIAPTQLAFGLAVDPAA
jgi:hypothetical protein